MNRYKSLSITQRPVGWRYEGIRHSLAARGFRTSFLGRKSKIVDEKFKSSLMTPGTATSKGINREFLGLAKDAALKDDEFDPADVKHLERAIRERRGAKQRVSEAIEGSRENPDYVLMKANEKSLHDEYFQLEKDVMEGKIDDQEYIRRLVQLRDKEHRHSMAVKQSFGDGVKEVLLDPVNDLNADWRSYEETAGHEYVPPANAVEKAQDAGAALVGRVVTLQNVEPMIDYEKGRSWKDSMVDIEFGRERRQAMAYVPTYGAADLPIIGADAIGTAGAAAVSWVPLAVGAGVVYGGARYAKRQYDKHAKRKKKSYHRVSMATKSELLDQKMKLELKAIEGKITDDEYKKQYSELDKQMRDAK